MEKNLSEAVSLKEKGNSEYKSQKYESSIKYYTKALFLAPCLRSVLQLTADTLRESCTDDYFKLYVTSNNIPPTDKGLEDNLIVAHSYGNRSAALFALNKFEASIADIELAMYHGYPKKELKLYKRKALCLSYLGKQPEALEIVKMYKEEALKHLVPNEEVQKNAVKLVNEIILTRKFSSSANDTSTESHVSSSLSMNVSPDKGRCLVGKKNIPFGECVVSESPYVSVLYERYKYTHCNHCFKETLNIIPCYCCVFVGYCSLSCMQTAWKLYHWAECAHGIKLRSHDKRWNNLLGMTVRFLLTSLMDVQVLLKECLKSNLKTAISLLTMDDSTDISDLYKLVLQLSSSPIIGTNEMYKQGVDIIMDCYRNIFSSYFIVDNDSHSSIMKSLKEIITLHMIQLQLNNMTISIDIPPKQNEVSLTTRRWDQQEFGGALYLTASLFNHSCDYNLTRSFIGNRIELHTFRPLLKGEELCITYVPMARIGYTKKTERQRMIKLKRNFDCTCDICQGSSKEILRREYGWYGLSCPKCNNGLLPSPDEIDKGRSTIMSTCIDCGQTSDVLPLIKIKSDILSREKLDDMLLTHEKLGKILYKYNLELEGHCCKVMAALGERGEFETALKYTQQRCNITEAIHGSHSMELSNPLFDHCQVLLECGHIKAWRKMAKRTITLLEFHYGKNDEGAISLRNGLKIIQT